LAELEVLKYLPSFSYWHPSSINSDYDDHASAHYRHVLSEVY